MDPRPVVVVLAATGAFGSDDSNAAPGGANDTGALLMATLRQVVASGLPLVVVTTAALAGQAGKAVAALDVVRVPQGEQSTLSEGTVVSAGVLARPQAPGWLLLPAEMTKVKPATLNLMAAALSEHPVAYAQFRGRRGHPVAFSAELFSELVSLNGEDGVRRLLARYPAHGVEVADAGVVSNEFGSDAVPQAGHLAPPATLAAARNTPKT